MLSQTANLHDFEFDAVLDAVATESFRLGDLRNFRPIDQSDLKILEELDGFGQLAPPDIQDASMCYRSDLSSSASVSPAGLGWDDADMKPDFRSSLMAETCGGYRRAISCYQTETKPIDWLRGGCYNQQAQQQQQQQQQVAPVYSSGEPTLMELNVHTDNIFPVCAEFEEDLLSALTDYCSPNPAAARVSGSGNGNASAMAMGAPQDGRFCVPFSAAATPAKQTTYLQPQPQPQPLTYAVMQSASSYNGFPVACKTEPITADAAYVYPTAQAVSGSTLRALLEREQHDSDSQSEASVGPREPRGRAWSMDTNASGSELSTATSGVFEPSRSWTSQCSDAQTSNGTKYAAPKPTGRSRNFSTDSNSSSMSASSSEATSRSHRRRVYSSKRLALRAGGDQLVSSKKTSKLGCFWYQRDVKARNNLLPVPKMATDHAYEADYDQPNPKRLLQLGNEIGKMSDVLQSVPQPSSVSDDDDKLNTKREKNKFASRVCRLKKKARYEANKIKLFGLKHELGQLKTVLAEARQLISETNRNDRQQVATLSRRLRELARTRLGLMVAGGQTEYVNLVLDLAQHQHQRTRDGDQSASMSIRDRLLKATAVENPEMRTLALKHTLPTYAEYFTA